MYNKEPWIIFMTCFRHLYFYNIWTEQCTPILTVKWIPDAIRKRLQDQFIQKRRMIWKTYPKGSNIYNL